VRAGAPHRRAREAELEITNDVRLRASERKALEAAKKAAQLAVDQSARADRATRTAARTLVTAGMSLHDAGTLLGVSKQRVHQILASDDRRKGAA
jgi:hypothetical protein